MIDKSLTQGDLTAFRTNRTGEKLSRHTGAAVHPLFVFGYGSLMWSPGFEPDAVHPARVLGWHRRFSRVSTTSWGSPETPGLCAALHVGGTAWGRILQVPGAKSGQIMEYLDQRESSYLRRHVHVDARIDGTTTRLKVITYVANPDDPTLADALAPNLAHKHARHGIGTKGAAFDYVRNTVAALKDDGHTTSDAHRFFAMLTR